MRFYEKAGIEAIVFDFDGTLAETPLDFGEMKRQLAILARNYLPSVSIAPSMPALEWLASVAVEVQEYSSMKTAEEFRSKAETLIFDIEMHAAGKGKLFPYTRSMLRKLDSLRIRTAIITRNCTEAVRIVFPDLDDYCACLLTRDHVPHVKPNPEHLLRALNVLSALPGNALMVGDHPMDVETGKRAGALTAGVLSGKSSHEDLIRSGADFVARSCEALMDVLDGESLLQWKGSRSHEN
jgi:phosphoglycolate phosphatase